jgi:hypothetical protein
MAVRVDLVPQQVERLPQLIEQAAGALAKATTAGEVLEARDQAAMAYDAAKIAAHFAKVKEAHDTILAACHNAQANALKIEARAQCRLADEYDAAQARGEVQTAGGDRKSINVSEQNIDRPTVEDIGLTRKQIHEARQIRDAEKAEPGIVQRTVDAKLKAGVGPTRAYVRRAVARATATPASDKSETAHKPSKPKSKSADEPAEIEHDAASIRKTLDDVAEVSEMLVYLLTASAEQFQAARGRFETDDAFHAWLAENKLGGPDQMSAFIAISKHPDIARSIMVLIDKLLIIAGQRIIHRNKNDESDCEAAAPESVAEPARSPDDAFIAEIAEELHKIAALQTNRSDSNRDDIGKRMNRLLSLVDSVLPSRRRRSEHGCSGDPPLAGKS